MNEFLQAAAAVAMLGGVIWFLWSRRSGSKNKNGGKGEGDGDQRQR